MKTSVRFPKDLWRALKIRALDERRAAFDALVVDACRVYLKRKP